MSPETTTVFEGKKALVTGGTRGIGKAVALALSASGATVVVTSRHPDQTTAGSCIPAIGWNATEPGGIQQLLENARDLLGGLDLLVNNAGVLNLPTDHPDHGVQEAEWDYVLSVNLKAAYFLCRETAELLAAANGGTIVNIASDAGLRPAPDPYSISKWGVVGFTAGLAKSYAHRGVRINAVAPGPVATAMLGCRDGQHRESAELPLKRFSTPEEVADVTLFLASPASRAVFGQTLLVNSAN